MKIFIVILFAVLVFMMGVVSDVYGQGNQNPWAVTNFPIENKMADERYPATAYNFEEDEFLVVWSDYYAGNWDIYGRIMNADGTFAGSSFPICVHQADQIKPHVSYNRLRNEYLVVWQDDRVLDMDWDIYGIRIDEDGHKLWSPRSDADTVFVISDAFNSQFAPRIAHNYTDDTYLVVWYDYRNWDWQTDWVVDIWGQRLDWDADLLSPYASPATDVNYPLSIGLYEFNDYDADVAYHGSEGQDLNEWLVVWSRYIDDLYMMARIWGVRVRGTDGKLLDTWGDEAGPPLPAKTSAAAGVPRWYPQMPIGFDGYCNIGELYFYQGSPHLDGNNKWQPDLGKNNNIFNNDSYSYDIPEFMVVWSDFRPSGGIPDIYAQRVGYFPDSTAYRMGLKDTRGTDDMFTCVLLDTSGNVANPPSLWIDWPNYPVTTNPYCQTWNGVTYNQNWGEYLVFWLDWREQENYNGHTYPAPAADIYAHRLYLDPSDSSLIWLDNDGSRTTDKTLNIPVAVVPSYDEGNAYYPAGDHGIVENEYLIAYEMDWASDDSNIDIWGALYSGDPKTGVETLPTVAPPKQFALFQNYPNPFNPETTIGFDLPRSERTVIRIFDALGREIVTLLDQDMVPGKHRVMWNSTDSWGRPVSSGIYFYRIKAGDFKATAKMVLLR